MDRGRYEEALPYLEEAYALREYACTDTLEVDIISRLGQVLRSAIYRGVDD